MFMIQMKPKHQNKNKFNALLHHIRRQLVCLMKGGGLLNFIILRTEDITNIQTTYINI